MRQSTVQKAVADRRLPSAGMLMTGRMLVGLKAAFPHRSVKTSGVFTQLEGLRRDACGVDVACAIILTGELDSKDAALLELRNSKLSETLSSELEHVYSAGASGTESRIAIRQLGWFGELAMASTDEQRQVALRPAKRAFLTYACLLVFGGLSSLFGAALLIGGVVWLHNGGFKLQYRAVSDSLPANREAYFELTIGVLVAIPLAGLATSQLPLLVRPIGMFILLFLVLWLRCRQQPWAVIRPALGLVRGQGVLKEVGWGVLGYVAGIPIIIAGILVSNHLMTRFGQKSSHPVSEAFVNGDPMQIGVAFFLAVVYAPLLEEIVFRGALHHYLRGRLRFVASGLISGVVFAAVHPQGWAAIPVLGAIGFVLSMIREWRGSLIGSITAHACHNGMTLCFLCLMVL